MKRTATAFMLVAGAAGIGGCVSPDASKKNQQAMKPAAQTRAIPGVCASSCFVSWNAILASNPDATILGGFGVNQGSGNLGLTTAVDKLTIGNAGSAVVYDFEQFKVPTDRRQCFDGGWMGLTDAEGNAFRNQGQCVAYVNRS